MADVNAVKNEAEVDKDVKAETKEKEHKSNDSPIGARKEVGPEVLFEVISRLRIVLDKVVNLSLGSSASPLASLRDRGSLKIKVIDKVESNLSVWYDAPNDVRYVITQCESKIKFTSIDEFLSAVVSDFRYESDLSLSILAEPERLSVYAASKCYNPEKMGFPYDQMLESGILDDVYRVQLNDRLQGRRNPDGYTSFSQSHVFEYAPRSRSRELLLQHSIGNTQVMLDLWHGAMRAHCSAVGSQEPDIRELSGFETLHPTYPFNAVQGVLDAMPRSGYILRYESVSSLSGFSVTLSPIPTGDLMKSAGASATKATWLSDLTTANYHDSMAPEIAGFLSSLVVPGEIVMDLDLSDIPETSTELRAAAAMCFFMLIQYDQDSTFTTTTRNSIILAQRCIVRMGLQCGVFRQIGAGGVWPLDDVAYQNGPIEDLDGFRVINGQCGINQGNYVLVDDALRMYFPDCGRRINYAMNYSDYYNYSREILGPTMWSPYEAIKAFIGRCRPLSYLNSYYSIVAKNLMDFYVRVNQHNSGFWYSSLRSRRGTQNARNAQSSSELGVKSALRGKTVIYLARALNGQKELIPNFGFKDILKISSGAIRSMSDLASERTIVERLLVQLAISQEYSDGEIIKMIGLGDPFIDYVRDVGRFHNELHYISRNWLNSFLILELTECFHPLRDRALSDFVSKGVIPKVIAHVEINMFKRNFIRRLIRDKQVYVNVYEDPCQVVDSHHLGRLIEHRAYKSLLYDTCDYPIEIALPVPFSISHALDSSSESYCISVNNSSNAPFIRLRVKIEEFKLYILSFDTRKFCCLDDYTPNAITVQNNFVRGADIAGVYYSIDNFFARLGEYAILTTLLCNKRHCFVDL